MDYAELFFDQDGTPKSATYDDIYYSQGLGQAESQHAFIEPNRLRQRFQALRAHQHFTIGETGFGTGLNFMVAWQTFLDNAPLDARLTFVSCERYPVAPAQLAQSHQHWPELMALAEQLQAQYPPPLSGYHLLEFGRVNLLLLLDDAAPALAELTAQVDAWFLDGFSPVKNPDMWCPALFVQLNRLSRAETTLATFSSARVVRDGLVNAGFRLEKLSGFGKKRNSFRADFIGRCEPPRITGWPSSHLPAPKANAGQHIAIIGAGLAGASTAAELSKRGYRVSVFEQQDGPAQGGSGNSQGAVYAKLSALPEGTTRFYAQALIRAQALLAQLPETVPHGACGLVQLVHNPRELKRLQELSAAAYIPPELAVAKTADQLSALTGLPLEDPGLWFAGGGWVSPALWVQHLLQSLAEPVHLNCRIVELAPQSDGHGWRLTDARGQTYTADQVVIASAFEANQLAQTEHLRLNTIAGQVTRLAVAETGPTLKAVICTDRYVMPALNGQLTIGSTFRLKSTQTDVRPAEHSENIASLRLRVPSLLTDDVKVIGGRAGVRCTSPDYLPLVGPISNPEALWHQFRIALQRNRTEHETPAEHLPGLWLNVAHGSKGLCSSPLSARLLAAMIAGEPYPVQQSVADQLNPNRFVVRDIVRGKREKA
ncbi:bifunctional tRNA (5-methylaminomethyl-2-thiouridine)(34)-methyltransferase MnmD/FAD-dependent 5-carboxymethylaminomethyl-2-thiouridine(34) oxidoreductase MnmC [Reinekea sp.]|uniref:bifunctional tRNA (5-methylaminomethyl-2-thiouridine)(34)-methyltransferase MnmD/FAD-dependent 5-carboxymethylaminomethyl-2-thiouridine(34) oxidoreductase MnmC n=1 Tax=Reinekea sp. TaxID=1970455 RepID=UPI002A81BDF7|nr:bifunctional tRNA (5-methylaminomethyl-2-thiouridine)(34)-methyltransferase MnmD/FAD-dependent 5-carboxymethylaminomethyl-2-thiouridine(34) oxidoreductase MnmC [Reinekea sp.]